MIDKMIIFSIVIFFIIGINYIIIDIMRLENLKAKRVIKNIFKKEKKETIYEKLVYSISEKIVSIIKINDYNKKKLRAELKMNNIHLSEEMYVAKCITKSMLIILLAIPFNMIMPISVPIIVVFAIAKYFQERNKPSKMLEEIRNEVEYELPRFVNSIAQELHTTKDVIQIMDNYRRVTKGKFKQELEKTLSDMKTGNIEQALLRFEMKISSSMVSDTIRGLIGVARGDENIIYFQMLAHDFKQIEITRLKREVLKKPAKIKKNSAIVLGAFMFLILSVIMISIVQNMDKLF